jgi:hypothetical protein
MTTPPPYDPNTGLPYGSGQEPGAPSGPDQGTSYGQPQYGQPQYGPPGYGQAPGSPYGPPGAPYGGPQPGPMGPAGMGPAGMGRLAGIGRRRGRSSPGRSCSSSAW